MTPSLAVEPGRARLTALETADGMWRMKQDRVLVGDEYDVDLSTVKTGTWFNMPRQVYFEAETMDVWDRENQRFMPLPTELLEIIK